MHNFTRVYTTYGLRIKVFSGHAYFLEILDAYFGEAAHRRTGRVILEITLRIYLRKLPRARHHKKQRRAMRFENSSIDTYNKRIYSYYADFSMTDQPGILLRPMWCLLYFLGYYPLHAALVKKEGHYLAFFGSSGSGKSTLASLFALKGFTFLCDDHFFVKNAGRYFKIIPFAKKTKIRNIERKESLQGRDFSAARDRAYFYAKKLVCLFPRYRAGRNLCLKPISMKQGILHLIGDNLSAETGQPDNRAGQIKMLDFFCQFEKRARFFELVYNDKQLPAADSFMKDVF